MEQELLEIIKEVLALETENVEIEKTLQILTTDIKNYQDKDLSDSPFTDDRLIGVGILNVSLIVAAYYGIQPSSVWETNDLAVAAMALIFDACFSTVLLHSYFKEKKANKSQEKIDYSKLISELSKKIETLQNTHSANSDRIQVLNNKILEFKECMVDLCIQRMSESDTTYSTDSIQKTLGTYEERR